jgi:xanthine dehydrogenase small subunit
MNHPTSRPLRFLRSGQTVTLHDVPPDRTLLDLLRDDLHCTGTKEGCGEGDCGACTVVIGERITDAEDGSARLQTRAINSCIRLAHSIDGMALWTVEDIAGRDGAPHPAQEAMVRCHGSQCGFCTPGFVMSLFALHRDHAASGEPVTRAVAQEALSGNLCRCTGYRPILDAAQQMNAMPGGASLDERDLLSGLKLIAPESNGLDANFIHENIAGGGSACPAYQAPTTLAALVAARATRPGTQIVAGCTDVGLWVTKQHRRFAEVLDVTRAAELRCITWLDAPTEAADTDAHRRLRIGAAVSLTDAYAALVELHPSLREFSLRFAGVPVRNSGTLGGNVANGSPIGDSMPLLIALNAEVVLASVRGERSLPLEDLYTGYRQNVMAPDEIVAYLDIPLTGATCFVQAYKISKRHDDDISAVCLVIALGLSADGSMVDTVSIGAGGVAATPARALKTEAALHGKPWTHATIEAAEDVLRGEFTPISDMRASGAYRSTVLVNLLERFWLESQGSSLASLGTLNVMQLGVDPHHSSRSVADRTKTPNGWLTP